MKSLTDSNCVWGGQGSPEGPGMSSGPAKTTGSLMKSRAQAQGAPAFFRAAHWIALFAIVAAFGLSSASLRAAESAGSFFKRGQSAEAKDDLDGAFNNYQKAFAKAPKNLEYRTAFYRIRISASAAHVTKGRKLLEAGNEQGALAEFLHAAEIDPSNESAEQGIAAVRKKNGETAPMGETSLPVAEGKQEEMESLGTPAELKLASSEPLTLHMQEDSKVVYQAVGKAAGVNVIFDPAYTSKRIQVDLNNVSLLDALRIVGTISNTFWRAVTSNTIFVAENSRQKHTDLDEQAVETFYLSNAWQQTDLTDVGTAIRNLMPNAKVYPVPSQNAIVMRGTPDELLLAQKLVDDLDKSRAEVVVDIAILEVSKNWEKTLGIAWPSSVGIALQPPTSSSTTSTTTTTGSTSSGASPTLYDLSHLKATDFAVTVGSATANLLLTDSNTKILQNPRLRAADGQKATFKSGEKIPIATGSYQSSAAVSAVSGLVNTQFTYTDVGVNIEMTPTIHFDHDVTLKIKIEDTSQSGSVTISGVTEPIIAQKTIEQVIRLREGEASILGGIQNKQDQVSWSGIPGLSSIPGLKYLFGSKDHSINDDELVFLVVPHVVRTQTLENVNLRTIDTGTGASVEVRHIPLEVPNSDGPKSNPAANPAAAPAVVPVRPIVNTPPKFGTVPGQSALAAAPAALDQIRGLGETGNAPALVQPAPAPPTAAQPRVSFTMAPLSAPLAVGAAFKVPVVLNGGADITSIPLQISYDPSKLELVNVDSGEFLSRDGQAVLLSHRDDGPGAININASRTPGAAGVSGSGEVCILSFQAKASGASAIIITHPGAVNSKQLQLPAQGARLDVQVK
jgi:general secretion pathway protein D